MTCRKRKPYVRVTGPRKRIGIFHPTLKTLLDRHTLELSNEELEINLYLLNQREHAIALYSQQLYGMKRTANRLSNTSTSFQDQLQHMN